MIFLLAIHLGTNYLAVRAVCMRTLNRQRANLAFSTALDHVEKHSDGNLWKGLIALETLSGPTPNDIRCRERVFEEDGVLRWNESILGYCKVGVNLRTLLACFSDQSEVTGSYSESLDFGRLLTIFNDVPYIIWYDEPRRTFLIVLEADANPESELSACKKSNFLHYCFIHCFRLGKNRADILVSHQVSRLLNSRKSFMHLLLSDFSSEFPDLLFIVLMMALRAVLVILRQEW